MRTAAAPETGTREQVSQQASAAASVPWQLIVWDDPVNLMSYVTYVFSSYFGYPKAKAERLMMQVHTEGKAIVASGNRETMEIHAQAMHSYGLWATVDKAGE